MKFDVALQQWIESPRKSFDLGASIILLLTLLAYLPAIHGGFVWDDDAYVTANPLLTAPDGWQQIWFSQHKQSQYFPMVYTVLRAERALWEFIPLGYHMVNVLLHCANALLVWAALRRLTVPGAWLAAAIFALHPVQVETAAWITELKNTLSTFFYLLTVLAWMKFTRDSVPVASDPPHLNPLPRRGEEEPNTSSQPAQVSSLPMNFSRVVVATEVTRWQGRTPSSRRGLRGSWARFATKSSWNLSPYGRGQGEGCRWGWYALALVLYALALFSKTTACTLPAALILVLWLKREPIGWRRLVQVVPFLIMGVAMGFVSVWWERHLGSYRDEFALLFTPLERLLIASRAFWFYLGKLVWPTNLTFSYPRWEIDVHDPSQYLWLIACLVFAGYVWWCWRTEKRGTVVAFVFFVAALSPMLGFISLFTFRYSFVADHYQYLACIGPIAFFAAAITKKSASPALRFGLPCLVLLVLGALTWQQGHAYKDEETLWRDTIVKNPHSWLANNNLGVILAERGDAKAAIPHFEEALRVLPDDAATHSNLGNALSSVGRIEEAIAHYRAALRIQPELAAAKQGLANALSRVRAIKPGHAKGY